MSKIFSWGPFLRSRSNFFPLCTNIEIWKMVFFLLLVCFVFSVLMANYDCFRKLGDSLSKHWSQNLAQIISTMLIHSMRWLHDQMTLHICLVPAKQCMKECLLEILMPPGLCKAGFSRTEIFGSHHRSKHCYKVTK